MKNFLIIVVTISCITFAFCEQKVVNYGQVGKWNIDTYVLQGRDITSSLNTIKEVNITDSIVHLVVDGINTDKNKYSVEKLHTGDLKFTIKSPQGVTLRIGKMLVGENDIMICIQEPDAGELPKSYYSNEKSLHSFILLKRAVIKK
jgi:hypothetical protein